jgi:N-acetylneuraminic acid mutarotase
LSARVAGTLPVALQDAAAATLPDGRVVLLGGLEASDVSTDAVSVLEGGGSTALTTLPEPQHDAAAVTLGANVYLFGGGQVESYSHILRLEPLAARVSEAGTLPEPASDVAAATIGQNAYVVGGYNGVSALDQILVWRPGQAPVSAARLPSGVRYAAVAAAEGHLIIAGGSEGETARDAILSFDPVHGTVRQIGRLPQPLTHASAVTLGRWVYVIGGRGAAEDSQSSAIVAIDPRSGAVRSAGQLPYPLSDASAARTGAGILLAGGRSPQGTKATILELQPRAAAR